MFSYNASLLNIMKNQYYYILFYNNFIKIVKLNMILDYSFLWILLHELL